MSQRIADASGKGVFGVNQHREVSRYEHSFWVRS